MNLKVLFTGDASGAQQGAKEARDAIREFDSSASSAIDHFARLFGTSMGQISSGLKTFQGGLLTLNKGLNGTNTAATATSKSLDIFKIALASTGIGALIIALGSLIAYFTKSQRGADMLARGLAPVKQVFATITDFAVKAGEAIVWAFQNPKEAMSQFIEIIKNQIINRITALINSFKAMGDIIQGIFTFDWDKVKEGFNDYVESVKQGVTGMTKNQRQKIITEIGGAWDEVKNRSQRAYDLEVRRQSLIKKERDERLILAELEARSAELRQKAEDKQAYTAKERLLFSKQAESTVNELINRRKAIEEERLAIKIEENSLSESMNKDLDGEIDIKEKLLGLDKSRSDRLKEIRNNQKGITDEVRKQFEIAEKAAALQAKKEATLTLTDVKGLDAVQNVLSKPQTIPLKLELPSDEFENLRTEYGDKMKPFLEEINIDIGALASEGLSGFAESFGEAMGNMMTGENALKGFINGIVGMIANMVSNIGKMLISAGIGMINFRKLLTNPFTAIAAGAAMVALASLVKTAIGNTINNTMGGGSESMGGGYLQSGSTTTIPGIIQQQGTMSVNVTGKLKASGNELIAVIESENNRRKLTT